MTQLIHNDQLVSSLKRITEEHGLIYLGTLPIGVEPEFDRFSQWLSQGMHGEMKYLERNRSLRKNPTGLLDGAKTATVIAWKYQQPDEGKNSVRRSSEKSEAVSDSFPDVAQYARLKDYHKVLWRKCESIAKAFLSDVGHKQCNFRVLTDSAPLLERALAARTQSGFVGKNTCYISHEHGSFLLLCEILWDFPIGSSGQPAMQSKGAEELPCGTCKRCQMHCPTGALSTDYQLDARRCLAYYSIEHRGPIPTEFWHGFSRTLFGCDICQKVCPHNRGKEMGHDLPVKVDPADIDLVTVATMDSLTYQALFGGTPMTRAKIDGLRRNALICMVVRRDERLSEVLEFWQENDPPEVIKETIEQIAEYRTDPIPKSAKM